MARSKKPSGERTVKPLRRRAGTRPPKRTFVVFCEGEKTEPQYLRALNGVPEIRRAAAVRIDVQPATGKAPITLVDLAVNFLESTNIDSEVDEVWCVFDVESPTSHPTLMAAVDLAEARGIRLAISNPCFELWLALHFADHTRAIDTAAAFRLLKQHDKTPGKGLDTSLYMVGRERAAKRARDLDALHERNGRNFPDNNPSSGMHHFLAAVIAAS